MLGHDNEELEGLTQLNDTSNEFGGAVPSGSNIPHHQNRWDFTANTGSFEVSTDGRAVNGLLS